MLGQLNSLTSEEVINVPHYCECGNEVKVIFRAQTRKSPRFSPKHDFCDKCWTAQINRSFATHTSGSGVLANAQSFTGFTSADTPLREISGTLGGALADGAYFVQSSHGPILTFRKEDDDECND